MKGETMLKLGMIVKVHKPKEPEHAWTNGMDKYDGHVGCIEKILSMTPGQRCFQISGMKSRLRVPYYCIEDWLEKIPENQIEEV